MRISRRMILLPMASAAVLAGTVGTVRWMVRKPEDFVVGVLRGHLQGLRVDPAHFVTFAADYVRERENYQRQLAMFSFGGRPLGQAVRLGLLPPDHGFARTKDNIVSQFLLSTDFFQNGAATDRPVNYVGFYDPHTQVCRNPFMKFA